MPKANGKSRLNQHLFSNVLIFLWLLVAAQRGGTALITQKVVFTKRLNKKQYHLLKFLPTTSRPSTSLCFQKLFCRTSTQLQHRPQKRFVVTAPSTPAIDKFLTRTASWIGFLPHPEQRPIRQSRVCSQSLSILPVAASFPRAFVSKMTGLISTGATTTPEWLALGIFIPSAVNKIANPSAMEELWPTLPKWFWRPAGIFEMTAALLTVFASPPFATVGVNMLYTFMGGVFASLLYIPNDKGYTHISGKGKLEKMGWVPLIPATGTTALLYRYLDRSTSMSLTRSSVLGPLLWGCLGFGLGAWIYDRSGNLKTGSGEGPDKKD